MDLKFKRKITKSRNNKSTVITVPRSIAQAWGKYSSIELAFDGERLVIKPITSDNA